jgi:methylglutaconyl-CoA hydratase
MSHVRTHAHGNVVTIELQRPEVHNAFDAALIADLTETIDRLGRDPSVRSLVLTGNGASFSAGADLNWMQAQLSASELHNLDDARKLAQLMRTLAYCPKPTLARVNGSAFGGGVGLIACCDVAIAVPEAKFGLTESKLGLAPAVISPYVLRAIGARQALRYFQTAEIFGAERALAIGLLHEVVPAQELDQAIAKQAHWLSQAGPIAVAECKKLVHRIDQRSVEQQMMQDEENAHLIARLRVSSEGQEGLSAFLAKRKPSYAT